jgi:hypothetical protein
MILDKNRYYNRIHLIFLEQNPNITTFDLYRPSWEFLKDSPKFKSISAALSSNPCVRATNKRKAAISPDDGNQLFSPGPNSSTVETPSHRDSRPLGKKASKRRQEEDKIIENVSSQLRDGLSNNPSSDAGIAIANALGHFTTIISTTLQHWQDRQSYENADPELKKRYDELLLKEKIYQMEETQRRREMRQQWHNEPQQQRNEAQQQQRNEPQQQHNEAQQRKETQQLCHNRDSLSHLDSDSYMIPETQV